MDDNLWTTYRMADGSLVYGEYAFVTDPEFFEDGDEPIAVVKETWVRVNSEVVTFFPFWWEEEEYEEYEEQSSVEKIRTTQQKEG